MNNSKKLITQNSSGIQADGDVIVNFGLTFEQVEKLTKFFLEENFPKLREDAMKTAHDNVDALLKEFEKQLQEKFATINPQKFSDPDVQSSINDAVFEAAKRGNKSNLELLVDLIFKRVQQKDNDLQSLIAGEAINVVSKLSTGQINFLSLLHFFQHMNLPNCTDLRQYDPSCAILLPLLTDVDKISGWEMQHLESQRCVVHIFIGGTPILPLLKKKNSGLKDREESILRQEIDSSEYFKHFVSLYELHNMNQFRLTIIGQMISAINIARYSPQSVDFNNFIK